MTALSASSSTSIMRALVYHGNHDIRYDPHHTEPEINHADEVKIKVIFCGICGSDLHEYLDGPIFFANNHNTISKRHYVQCMGHEMCGEVVEVGTGVRATHPGIVPGLKVVVEPTGTCLDKGMFSPDDTSKCPSCAQGFYNTCSHITFTGLAFGDGGFSEYCVVGKNHIVPYPQDIIPDDVAALTEPLAVTWHAVRKSGAGVNDTVLILGAGPIGLGTIFALKGHRVKNIFVSEPALGRRQLAAEFVGESNVFDPSHYGNDIATLADALRQKTPHEYGFHHIYDCSGVPNTFNASIKCLTSNGTATNIAIWPNKPLQFYPMEITLKERKLTGSMCSTKYDFEQVIEAYKEKLIDPQDVRKLISSITPLSEGIKGGFLELINNKDKHFKILLDPTQ